MTSSAKKGLPIVGMLLLCVFCVSAALDLDGECSDPSVSGVCPPRGKSMLQTSSSIAAVHSEGQPAIVPEIDPFQYKSVQHEPRLQKILAGRDWSIIDSTHACEDNDDNITRTYTGGDHTLESCKGQCLIDPQCRAIDYFRKSRYCNTFSKPCATPKVFHQGGSSWAFQARIATDQCNMVKMVDKITFAETPLRPRAQPARVLDFSQIAFEHELPLLRLRLAEMGPYVDEFHIAEGNHDFAGRPKDYILEKLLADDPVLAKWRAKIVHHKVNSTGHQLDTIHVAREIEGSGVLLEGDMDEVISRTFLNTLKHCEPSSGEGWNATVQMPFLQWNMGWTPCEMCYWRDATVVHELNTKMPSFWENSRLLQMPQREEASPWAPWAGSQSLQMPIKEQDIDSYFGDGLSSYVKRSYNLMVQVDGRPAGWHISWTLDGAKGIANKYLYGWFHKGWKGTYPEYLKPHMGTEERLAKFLEEKFLKNPADYETWMKQSTFTKEQLPVSVVEEPEKYKVQLGHRLYEMLSRGQL